MHLRIPQAGLWFAVFICLDFSERTASQIFHEKCWTEKVVG